MTGSGSGSVPSPLDILMKALGISNHDLVAASPDQLTHKAVQKGRRGKKLTANMQAKIIRALRALVPERTFKSEDLFPGL